MMKLKHLAVLLVVVALLGTACGGKRRATASGAAAVSPGATASASASAEATRPPQTDPFGRVLEEPDPHAGEEGAEGGEHAKEASSTYSAKNPPSTEFRRADTGESATGTERIQLALKIVPGCAELGTIVKVTVRTKPDVQVGLLSNVPTQDGRASEARGRSDANGLFTWLLQIPSNSTVGTRDVFAAVADDHGSDGGRSGDWLFVVAAPGGC